jgi:hypothetical protein
MYTITLPSPIKHITHTCHKLTHKPCHILYYLLEVFLRRKAFAYEGRILFAQSTLDAHTHLLILHSSHRGAIMRGFWRKTSLFLLNKGTWRIFWGFCKSWFLIDPLPFQPFRFWLRIGGDICNLKTTTRLGKSESWLLNV